MIKKQGEIREEEEHFRLLYQKMPVPYHSLDENGKILDVNPAWLHSLGYSKEEALGRSFDDFLSPEYQQLFKERVAQFKKKQEVIDVLYEMVRKNGTRFWVELSEKSGRDQQGNFQRTYCVFFNATKRKKAEQKVLQAAEEWQRTFDAISDLLFIQDKDFTITKVNKAMTDALKVKAKDLVGKKCYQAIHNMDKPWENCPFEQTRKDKKPHVEEVNDPHIGIPLLITTSPIFDGKNEFVGSAHIAKDISMIKKTEEELKNKTNDLAIFQKAAVGREEKMIELKKRTKELEAELGKKT